MGQSFDFLSRRDFLLKTAAALSAGQIVQGQTPNTSESECVFCRIVAGKLAAQKIWEDSNFLAFLDHKPINAGHTLLIPKKHVDYLFDIEEPLYSKMLRRAKMLAKILKPAMQSQRVGVLVEGFGVAHAHIHLVPINKGDGFGSRKGTAATDDELKIIAGKIKKAMGKE